MKNIWKKIRNFATAKLYNQNYERRLASDDMEVVDTDVLVLP